VDSADDLLVVGLKVASSADREDLTQRWGILESSRRISAVRSTSLARTQAMPPRPLRHEINPSGATV